MSRHVDMKLQGSRFFFHKNRVINNVQKVNEWLLRAGEAGRQGATAEGHKVSF